MKKILPILYVFLFLVLCALPGLQMIFGFAKIETLHGVEENTPEEFPSLSVTSFLSEHFQRNFQNWLDANIGFRGQLVRSDNQLNFDLFREISASYASPLIVGRRNSLFEKLYVEHLNGNGYVPEKRLENLARRLRRLQELLKARDIDFTLLISPSKAMMYEEDIPERYLDKERKSIPSNYERLIPLLNSKNINYVDGRMLLTHWKRETEVPVFPKGGTHWSQLAACRVGSVLVSKLAALSQLTLRELPCSPVKEQEVPEPFDRDLADLANLWNPLPFYEKLLYPVLPETKSASDASQPRMLFVGGSFLWNLFVYLDGYQVYSQRDMFYYFNRRFRYPSNETSPLNRSQIDWENDVFNNRFIVVEVNEITIHSLGSGFVEDALSALKQSSRISTKSAA